MKEKKASGRGEESLKKDRKERGWDRASLPPAFPRSAVIASEAEKWITLLLQHFLI